MLKGMENGGGGGGGGADAEPLPGRPSYWWLYCP